MRTMLRVIIPTEAGNAAFQADRMGPVLGGFMEKWQPEAAYFGSEDGKRTAYFVVDLQDAGQIPAMFEPLFQGLNAEIHTSPVMNPEDLQKGLASLE